MTENTPEHKPIAETFNSIGQLSIVYLDLLRDICGIRFNRKMTVAEAVEYVKTSRLSVSDVYREIMIKVEHQDHSMPPKEIDRDFHNQIVLMKNAFRNLSAFTDLFLEELYQLHISGFRIYPQQTAKRIKRLKEQVRLDFAFHGHEIPQDLMHIIACLEVMNIISQSDSVPATLRTKIERYVNFTKADLPIDIFFLTRIMRTITELQIINDALSELKKQITEFQKEHLRLLEIYEKKYRKGESDIWDVMVILQSAESYFEDIQQNFTRVLSLFMPTGYNHNSIVEQVLTEYIQNAKSNVLKTGKTLESMKRKLADFGEKHIGDFLDFIFSKKGRNGRTVTNSIEDRYQRIKSDIYSFDSHLSNIHSSTELENESYKNLKNRLVRFAVHFTTPSDFIDLITELLLQAHPELKEEISAVVIKEEDIINLFNKYKDKFANRFEELRGVLDGIKTGMYIYERDFDDVKRQLLKHYPIITSTIRCRTPNLQNEILKVLYPIKHLFLYMKKIDGGYACRISNPEELEQLNEMMRIFDRYYTTAPTVNPRYLNSVINSGSQN